MKTISLQVSHARTLPQKIIGLIGAKKPQVLLLKTRFGIHTFGVRFPIDVIVLDGQNNAVLIKKSLKSNRVFFWNPRFDVVVELPEGMIERSNIKLGDSIKLV